MSASNTLLFLLAPLGLFGSILVWLLFFGKVRYEVEETRHPREKWMSGNGFHLCADKSGAVNALDLLEEHYPGTNFYPVELYQHHENERLSLVFARCMGKRLEGGHSTYESIAVYSPQTVLPEAILYCLPALEGMAGKGEGPGGGGCLLPVRAGRGPIASGGSLLLAPHELAPPA